MLWGYHIGVRWSKSHYNDGEGLTGICRTDVLRVTCHFGVVTCNVHTVTYMEWEGLKNWH